MTGWLNTSDGFDAQCPKFSNIFTAHLIIGSKNTLMSPGERAIMHT